jgi:hypothetical protein
MQASRLGSPARAEGTAAKKTVVERNNKISARWWFMNSTLSVPKELARVFLLPVTSDAVAVLVQAINVSSYDA